MSRAAVCDNCRYLQQAAALIDAVHSTLGHQRSNSSSAAAAEWLPGASAEHPTAAGLRIGKPHPEGGPAIFLLLCSRYCLLRFGQFFFKTAQRLLLLSAEHTTYTCGVYNNDNHCAGKIV
jgi:hypothetical protein